LICAAATIWLLPSASLGEGGEANRLDGALKRTTQQLAAAVQQAVAPVTSGVQSTLAKTQADLEATRRALQRARARAAARATATDPARQPPLHGTNPHGQGGVATVDLNPSNQRPLGPSTDGSDSGPEDIVVGRARGEQTANGAYHGHITILALFGNDLLGVDSAEGETKTGPLQPLQSSVLDPLCTSTNGQVCLSVLTANSTTTGSGSQNDFALARASVVGLGVGAAESGGSSGETTKDCQTSVGTAKTANVATAGGQVVGVANSGTSSQSCRGQAPKVASTSQVVALGGNGIPLPASGCDNGTADTLVEVPLLAKIVCNADEVAGAALVRDALDVFAINSGTSSLVRESTAASEALSVAPSGPETPGPACSDGVDNDGDGVADGADPGCHTDGDAKNPASYNPSDTSEEDESPNKPSGENGQRECSDNKDNDGDKKVDEDDPGCHSDGNPNNPASYNPRDDDESDDGGGDNGGGGGGGDTAKPLSSSGLPLTGSNVLGLALSGLLVLAGGLLLRRREGAHPGA
jgi:LPXTG-motif cell wall-anchored protein